MGRCGRKQSKILLSFPFHADFEICCGQAENFSKKAVTVGKDACIKVENKNGFFADLLFLGPAISVQKVKGSYIMQHNEMNPELQAKLDGAESLDDVVRICAEAGIAISKEQLEAMDKSMANGELTAEALDAVSGGLLADLFNWWRNRGRKRSSGGGGNGSFGGGGSGGSGFRG